MTQPQFENLVIVKLKIDCKLKIENSIIASTS